MFRTWVRQYLHDPQIVILGLILAVIFVLILWLGKMLTPVAIALVIAYLLEGMVGWGIRIHIPRRVAVVLVFSVFMAVVLTLLIVFVPMLTAQVGQFVQDLPGMLKKGQTELMALPQRYPELVAEDQILRVLKIINDELSYLGQKVLSISLSSVRGIITILVYLVLVPLLVFFFLRDKHKIINWLTQFLPEDRHLAAEVWVEFNTQVTNYVRGKIFEILIVFSVSYATFAILGLKFSLLIGVLVGLSVIVPYIGATVVTLPVALMAFFQWGATGQTLYVIAAYGVIQFFDGNLLAPLLLSEVVNIHPVAVIVAILIFGGLWGGWGLFFAIPLATLVHALIKAWLSRRKLNTAKAETVPKEA